MKVSVIMPAYNAELYIDEAIQSVLNQTYENIELVIINDGSTDSTSKIVSKYLNDKRLLYIEQENKGVSAARNVGIKACTGELIAFLDSDDLWHKDKVEKQVDYFINNKDVYLVHTDFNILKDGKLIPARGRFVSWQIKLLPFYLNKLQGNIYNELLCQDVIGMLTTMVRRGVFSEVGYFDETMWAAEDWDLWIRVAKKYKIGYINEVLAIYRYNMLGYKKNMKKYEEAVFNVIKKHVIDMNVSDDIKRKSMSLFYTSMGGIYYSNGEIDEAQKRAIKGLKENIFNLRAYCLLIRTILK